MRHRNSRKRNRHDRLKRERSVLEPLHPAIGIEKYIDDKRNECAESTWTSHRSRLSFFEDWCEREEIENLNVLTGRDLHDYRTWRREDGELVKTSEKTQQDTLRVFIRWCESINAVRPGLAEKVQSPSLTKGQNVREEMVTAERASEIVAYLEKYRYGSLEHVVWLLLSRTGMRTGTAHALDVIDYQSETAAPHLEVHHRPDETPIKNRRDGERCIFLDASTCQAVDDYITDQRPDVEDEFGRDPLLATSQGRIAKSTIRKYAYKWTRPCVLSNECPHGRDPAECSAANDANKASECPSSRSAHPIRRGYVTLQMQAGVQETTLGERVNADPSTLKEHYDQRTEKQKMAQRKELIRATHREVAE